MKILHIIPNLKKGGAERIVINICLELIGQGHNVKIVTLQTDNQYSFITEKLDIQLAKTLLKISLFRKNQVDISDLQNIIDNFQPDVIHSHLFESEINLAFCRFPQEMKRIIHFHDNMVQMKKFDWNTLRKKYSISNYYERSLVIQNLPKNTTAIGVSKSSLQYINLVLPKSVRKILLLNAIDLNRFKKDDNPGKNHQIIMVGSLNELKGQELAIRTIEKLKSRNILISLTLVGDGPSAQSLKQLTTSLNLESQIKFTGTVDYPEKLLQDGLIYLHTSHSESFGLALIEAMACGLPVVCTDSFGNRELIIEGENGFMIWDRDPQLLADKIQFLYENKREYTRISQKAQQFSQNFGLNHYILRLIDLYQKD